MTDETLRKGDRVLPSGAGRTAAWPKRPGTVTRRLSVRTVEVHWDGTAFGDEMELSELTRLGDEGDASSSAPLDAALASLAGRPQCRSTAFALTAPHPLGGYQ